MILIFCILTLFILLFIILFFYMTMGPHRISENLSLMDTPFPSIDVVITWVNGNSPSFKNDLKSHGGSYQIDRFEQNEELRFCLRSIEKNLLFIHKIFIVVRDDQIPSFLHQDHYQLQFVKHSEIIPKQFLPTFNSISIENFIHKIPGLSEYFIYFNDDMMILHETQPFVFFEKETMKPITSKDLDRVHKTKEYRYWKKEESEIKPLHLDLFHQKNFSLLELVNQNNEILDLAFGKETRYRSQHVPYACRKSYLDHIDEFLKTIHIEKYSLYQHSGMYPFRNINSAARFSFFKKYFEIYHYQCSEVTLPLLTINIDHTNSIEKHAKNIPHAKESFLVIHNDGKQENDIYKNNFKISRKFLNEKFPLRSSYEK